MNLPGAETAQISPAKVRDYLLSPEHTVGRFKAAFFTRLGYSRSQWLLLDADLRALARDGSAVEGQASEFGRKYEVSGILKGPSGREAVVTTVWIVRHGENVPRLVTVFPGERR